MTTTAATTAATTTTTTTTTVTTNPTVLAPQPAVVPFTRRSGGVGVHGVYGEAVRQADGATLKAFLAAGVLATQTLAVGAGGVEWKFNSPTATALEAEVAWGAFFDGVKPVHAVVVELTNLDVDRLRTSKGAGQKMASVVYRVQPLIETARQQAKQRDAAALT
jgi:hypothetical protein